MTRLSLQRVAESAWLARFGDTIDDPTHATVLRAFHALKDLQEPNLRNLHPAYTSLLIECDPLNTDPHRMEDLLRSTIEKSHAKALPKGKRIEIPVVYGAEHGPDLERVASLHSLSTEQVIEWHTATTYRVYFLGFQPGFAYLGTLPEQLKTARHSTPRLKVPAGSVGIAGLQTGIYPSDSPGGWQILGRTSVKLFRPQDTLPSLLEIGDEVTFKAIRS